MALWTTSTVQGDDLVFGDFCGYERMDLWGPGCDMYMMWMSYGQGTMMVIVLMGPCWTYGMYQVPERQHNV